MDRRRGRLNWRRRATDTARVFLPREFEKPVHPWPLPCGARLVARYETDHFSVEHEGQIRGAWFVELWHQHDRRYSVDQARLNPAALKKLIERLPQDMATWSRLTQESAGVEYARPLHGNTVFVNRFPPGICLKADARFPGVFVVREFMLDDVVEALQRAAAEGPDLLAAARRVLTAEGVHLGADYEWVDPDWSLT